MQFRFVFNTKNHAETWMAGIIVPGPVVNHVNILESYPKLSSTDHFYQEPAKHS